MVEIINEVPLFIFVLLGIYTAYQLKKAKEHIGKSPIADSYKWFIFSAIFFTLWAIIHIYFDFAGFPEGLENFVHYIVSHGVALIGMAFIAIAAWKTSQFAYTWHEKGEG